MTVADQAQKERRANTERTIRQLQNERTEMLVLFCRVAGLEPFTNDKPVRLVLQEFCQILIDYIATAHFGLYERVLSGNERRRAVAELAEKLYPKIAASTEVALNFNDKYDCEDHCEIHDTLWQDLSELGQALAARIELEDQLIAALASR